MGNREPEPTAHNLVLAAEMKVEIETIRHTVVPLIVTIDGPHRTQRPNTDTCSPPSQKGVENCWNQNRVNTSQLQRQFLVTIELAALTIY